MDLGKKIAIQKSQDFIDEYGKYEQDHRYEAIRKYFLNRKFLIKNTELTYRILQHWCKSGLLDDHREHDGHAWRYFTIADLVWIQVLVELRAIGLPLDKLRNTYQSMFFAPTTGQKYKMFEFCIFQALVGTMVLLIVCPNTGNVDCLIDEDIPANIINLLKQNFISINLNACMKKVGDNSDYFSDLDAIVRNTNNDGIQDKSLSRKEQKIISAVRMHPDQEVTIITTNGQIEKISNKVKHDNNIRTLEKVLRNMQYGEVRLKIKEGRIILNESTKVEKV